MYNLPLQVSRSSIFQNYINESYGSIQLKDNSQIFLATSKIVKTASLYSQNNGFKIMDLTSNQSFEIHDLILNQSQSSLAVVGKKSIVVADVQDAPDFESTTTTWNCFSVTLDSFSSSIKSVLWHPASLKNSELVVLTENEILLYDIVLSLTQPMRILSFKDFDQLKGKRISSIAFGSDTNLSGSITLYVSTECGEVFAVYPFVYDGSTIKTTSVQLSKFKEDWDTFMNHYENEVPPSSQFDSYRELFSQQSVFVDRICDQLKYWLASELDANQIISLKQSIDSQPQILGPLCKLGHGCQLVQFNSNPDVSMFTAVHKDTSGRILISVVAQLLPLVFAFDKKLVPPIQPIKPILKTKVRKEMPYKPPAKGFGYVIDSDSQDDGMDDRFSEELETYNSELSLFKAKSKILQFVDKVTNKLTVLAVDDCGISCENFSKVTFKNLSSSVILLAVDKKVIVGYITDSSREFFDSPQSPFEITYQLFSCKNSCLNFALLNDDIEGSGTYLLSCSKSGQVETFKVKNTDNVQVEDSLKFQPFRGTSEVESSRPHTVLPAEELRMIITEADTRLSTMETLDFESTESLNQVHQLTRKVLMIASALTKYILALQAKLQLQLLDIRAQSSELSQIDRDSRNEKKFNEKSERLEKLIVRQGELKERADSLQRTIIKRFEKCKADQKRALSKAERSWFKELNSITKKIEHGDESESSLSSNVISLSAKVSELVSKKEKDDKGEALDETLAKLSIGSNLAKMNRLLTSEGKLISEVKARMHYNLTNLTRLEETLKI